VANFTFIIAFDLLWIALGTDQNGRPSSSADKLSITSSQVQCSRAQRLRSRLRHHRTAPMGPGGDSEVPISHARGGAFNPRLDSPSTDKINLGTGSNGWRFTINLVGDRLQGAGKAEFETKYIKGDMAGRLWFMFTWLPRRSTKLLH
jgi:hypothetical protein